VGVPDRGRGGGERRDDEKGGIRYLQARQEDKSNNEECGEGKIREDLND